MVSVIREFLQIQTARGGSRWGLGSWGTPKLYKDGKKRGVHARKYSPCLST